MGKRPAFSELIAILPSAASRAGKCRPFVTRHRFVDFEKAAIQRFAVHAGDGFLHSVSAFHRHKSKTSRAASGAIRWEMDISDQPVLFACGSEVGFRSIERKISDIYFGVHGLGLLRTVCLLRLFSISESQIAAESEIRPATTMS